MADIKFGDYQVGTHPGGLFKRFTVDFGHTFKSIPAVVANIKQQQNAPSYEDVFAVTLHNVSTTQAEVQIWRVDHPGKADGWNQSPVLTWIAIGD